MHARWEAVRPSPKRGRDRSYPTGESFEFLATHARREDTSGLALAPERSVKLHRQGPQEPTSARTALAYASKLSASSEESPSPSSTALGSIPKITTSPEQVPRRRAKAIV